MIYKTGDATRPQNYRPIALLNTLYNICAAMIKHRLIEGLYDRIDNQQFGFRPNQSTTQPTCITKILQSVAEATGKPPILLFWTGKKHLTK